MLICEAVPALKPIYERRALILDDNDANRLLLKFAMQMSNVEFVEAANGAAALTHWCPGSFSFAFLDIELPDINGLEVARRIRASDPDACIIMCSTNDDPHTISAAVEADCDLFLVKPFELDTLLTLVKEMDRSGLREAPRVLIVDNLGRRRWQARPLKPAAPTYAAPQ